METESGSTIEELYQARVLYNFSANTENELTLNKGEIVFVCEEDEPWALVRNINDDDGYVPLNYLEPLAEPDVAPPPPPRPMVKNPTDREIALPPTPKSPAPSNAPPGGAGIFMRPKAKSMDAANSPYFDIFASSMEWWACITLFISGVFTLMWGSAEVPEDTLDETLGTFQCLGAAVLVAYFSTYRDRFGGDRASIFRCVVLIVMSVICWLTLPIGIIGAGALSLASISNLLAFCYNSDAQTATDWLTLGLNLNEIFKGTFQKSFIGTAIFFMVHIMANIGYFILGMYIGQEKIDEVTEKRLILGDAWKYAEGWGTVIAINLALILLLSMYSVHGYLLDWAELHVEDADCCMKCLTRTILWSLVAKRQFFLHKVLAGTILVAAVGHMFECFDAYHASGAAVDFINIFGEMPFITGVPMIWCLTSIFAVMYLWDPVRKVGHKTLFQYAHLSWVLLILLPFFHGKGGWGSNYWMFMTGPLLLYGMDKTFRLLVLCCNSVSRDRDSE